MLKLTYRKRPGDHFNRVEIIGGSTSFRSARAENGTLTVEILFTPPEVAMSTREIRQDVVAIHAFDSKD